MAKLLLKVIFVLSSKWLEYRFNRDYGNFFFDYSLNGRYAENGGKSGTTRAKITDRGIYFLNDDSHVKIYNSEYLPSTFSISAWLFTPDTYFCIFYSKNNSYGISFGRYNTGDSFRLYINSDDNTGDNNCFLPSNFYSDQWKFLTLVYSSGAFKGYINDKVCLTKSFSYSQSRPHETGIGPSEIWKVLTCIIWNFVILDEEINFSKYLQLAGSSNCLLGPGTCNPCDTAFIDPILGTGCISTSMDIKKNALGIACDHESCTKTVSLNCSNSSLFCTYDQTTHSCFIKTLTSSLSSEPNTQIACTCESQYISRDNKCCDSHCSSCDYLNTCKSCYSNNAVYNLSKNCTCLEGFYSKGNFGDKKNCEPCSVGCSSCNSTHCLRCKDHNSYLNGSECVCNQKFFGSPDNCAPCLEECESCITSESCLSCVDKSLKLNEGRCGCSVGYYDDGVNCSLCNPSCKNCSSSILCHECKVEKAIVNQGDCICEKGFFGDASISCQPCDPVCSSCLSSSECLGCSDGNSQLKDRKCECFTGYFKSESFTCLKCHEECLTCEVYDYCTSCKALNSILVDGKCLCDEGFWSSSLLDDKYSCNRCHEMCVSCLNNSFCLNCTSNSTLVDGKCECLPGFRLEQMKCIQRYFHGTSYVENSYIVWIIFNETLLSEFQENDFSVHLESEKIEYILIKTDGKIKYGIEPKLSGIQKDSIIEVKINSKVFSVFGSILSTFIFREKINFSEENLVEQKYETEASLQNEASKKVSSAGAIAALGISLITVDPSSFFNFINTAEMIYPVYLLNLEINPILREFLLGIRIQNSIPNPFEYIIDERKGIILSKKMVKFGFKTSLLIINSGILFSILIINLIMLTVSFLAKCIPILGSKAKSFISWIIFSSLLKLWVQSFFELMITASISIKNNINSTDIQIIDVGLFLVVIITEFLMTFLLLYLIRKRRRIESDDKSEEFDEKYSIFFKDFKATEYKHSTFYLVFILRRAVIAIISQTELSGLIQLVIMLGSNFLVFHNQVLVYIIYSRSFKNWVFTVYHAAIEGFIVCFDIILIIGLCLGKLYTLGLISNICIYIIYICWSINALLSFYSLLVNLSEKIKKLRIFMTKRVRDKKVTAYTVDTKNN